MKSKMKEYEVEYKKSSVELFLASGKSSKQFARELGVPDSTLRDWVKKYGELYEKEPANDQEKLERLRKKLAEAQMENDLLKKAIAIFSKSLV